MIPHKNSASWFEIPTKDLDRAARFYETVLGRPMRREVFRGTPWAIFEHDRVAVGGALIYDERVSPSTDGALVYLTTLDIDGCLARVAPAGGEVLMPSTDIGEPGFIAVIRDTEGNRVALHAERMR